MCQVMERHFARKIRHYRVHGVEQGEGFGKADFWPGEYLQWGGRGAEGEGYGDGGARESHSPKTARGFFFLMKSKKQHYHIF